MKTVWTFEGTNKKYLTKQHAEKAAQGARVYEIEQEERKSGSSMEELKAELKSASLEALESAAAAVKPKNWK